jgi:hypothetical protein
MSGGKLMQDCAEPSALSNDSVELLISRMRHGIDICPFPADRCVYCDRDARCILLLQELLELRRKAGRLAAAA